jgi:hypothetical protein
MAFFRLGNWDWSGETGIGDRERETVCYSCNIPQFAKTTPSTQDRKNVVFQRV